MLFVDRLKLWFPIQFQNLRDHQSHLQPKIFKIQKIHKMIIKYDQLIIIYMKFPLRDETVINTSQSKNISTNLNLSNVALFTRKSLKHICLDKLPSHFPPHSTISNHTKYFMPPLICLNCRTLTTKINDTITPAE